MARLQTAAVGATERRLWLRLHMSARSCQQTNAPSIRNQKFSHTRLGPMSPRSRVEEMESQVVTLITDASNKSLDASDGSVFRIMTGAAMLRSEERRVGTPARAG